MMSMQIERISAFSYGEIGGNPAGVVIADLLPTSDEMQAIAKEVGYSETTFATREDGAWRVRYFSPEAEVPFCGHATIALGAALAKRHGDGEFKLTINGGEISVAGRRGAGLFAAALQSPPTRSAPADPHATAETLALFGLEADHLDDRVPPALIHAGADHLVLMLRDRATLAAMRYPFESGRTLMRRNGWGTVLLGYAESSQLFHTRNAFAAGGVYEDPATGASTAALAGYLRDLGWPHGGRIDVQQGDDMGMPSRLRAEMSRQPGASIRVSGTARFM
jgi:PhzF family phenazine biosynthesis protein